jgi:hypothetical protein
MGWGMIAFRPKVEALRPTPQLHCAKTKIQKLAASQYRRVARGYCCATSTAPEELLYKLEENVLSLFDGGE